jgi:hypothetical protein
LSSAGELFFIYETDTMNLLFFHLNPKQREKEPLVPALTEIRHPHNIYEGSEFLDDAIRTKEQPVMHTEEAVAVGSLEYLL